MRKGIMMRNAVIFATKYGSVRKASEILASKLPGDTDIFNINEGIPVLSGYENVVIGGSVYMGKIQASIRKYMRENMNELLQKKIGLFINSSERDQEKNRKQFEISFPEELRSTAAAEGFFGDEINIERVNLLDKIMLRLIKNVTESYSNISEEKITGFAAKLSDPDSNRKSGECESS
jgi:menaquinone-dependent protoporphyrinogen oxidase